MTNSVPLNGVIISACPYTIKTLQRSLLGFSFEKLLEYASDEEFLQADLPVDTGLIIITIDDNASVCKDRISMLTGKLVQSEVCVIIPRDFLLPDNFKQDLNIRYVIARPMRSSAFTEVVMNYFASSAVKLDFPEFDKKN